MSRFFPIVATYPFGSASPPVITLTRSLRKHLKEKVLGGFAFIFESISSTCIIPMTLKLDIHDIQTPFKCFGGKYKKLKKKKEKKETSRGYHKKYSIIGFCPSLFCCCACCSPRWTSFSGAASKILKYLSPESETSRTLAKFPHL